MFVCVFQGWDEGTRGDPGSPRSVFLISFWNVYFISILGSCVKIPLSNCIPLLKQFHCVIYSFTPYLSNQLNHCMINKTSKLFCFEVLAQLKLFHTNTLQFCWVNKFFRTVLIRFSCSVSQNSRTVNTLFLRLLRYAMSINSAHFASVFDWLFWLNHSLSVLYIFSVH